LLCLDGRLQTLCMTMADPRMAAESAARAAVNADPSPGPQAGVAKVASPRDGASAPLSPSTPPFGRAASSQEGVPKLADIPPFPIPGPAAGTAPLLHQQRTQLSLTTSRSPAAAPGPEAARATSGQFTITLRKADGGYLGLRFSLGDGGTALRIEGVCPEGAVASWNRLCRDPGSVTAGKAVGEGDELVAVETRETSSSPWIVSHDPNRMFQECQEKRLLKLTIVRGQRAPKALRAEAPVFVPGGA